MDKPEAEPKPGGVHHGDLLKAELRLITKQDDIFDRRAITVGVVISALLLCGAVVYRLAAEPIDASRRKAPAAFEFSVAEPTTDEPPPVRNPMREVLQARPDRMTDAILSDPSAVAERPNIQMTTDPSNTVVPKEEFIQSSQISVATPKIEVGGTADATDIVDAPVEISVVTDKTVWALPVIAAPTTGVADIPFYKNPAPRDKMATHYVNMAPAPGKPVKVMPQAWGPQDQKGIGQLGPMNINLTGNGEFFRNPAHFVDLRARSAVDSALNWLAIHQDPDGLWHCEKLAEPDTGNAACNLAATGLATLALMGGGNTTRKGPYMRNVLRGIEALIREQDAEGSWHKKTGHGGYTQGICTIALCEAYGRAHDERVGLAAQKAVAFCVKSRGVDGGWRYRPNSPDSDMSVSAWFVQALKAAKLAQIKFDNSIYSQALTFVDSCTDANASKDSTGYCFYQPGGHDVSGKNRPAITAAGMVIRQFTGTGVRNFLLTRGAEHIRNAAPLWKSKDFYYWYYATYAMHNMGDESRLWWNKRIRDVLIENQSRDGDNAGSWDPAGDRWAERGATRVYTTALGALCLEVYYRYNDALTSFGVPPSLDELFFEK